MIKNPPANAGDTRDSGLIPGLGRFPGVGNDNPLQYFCLENFMEPGGLQSVGVTQESTCTYACMSLHACIWRILAPFLGNLVQKQKYYCI